MREFKDFSETSLSGSVVDYVSGKEVTHGTYTVVVNGTFAEVDLTMQGSQQPVLHYKLAELTPDSLKFIDLDRGTELDYIAAK